MPLAPEHAAVLETAGVSPTTAARVCAACAAFSRIPPATLAARLGYLTTELELSRVELEALLVKWPRALDADSTTALAPRLTYLRRVGLTDPESLKRVALRAPAVLSSASLKGAIMPRVAALRTRVGLAPADVARVVTRSPNLLLASDAAIEERVAYLTHVEGGGLTRAQLARAVATHPALLQYAPASMHARVSFLREEVGLVPPALGDVLARAPALLSLDVVSNLRPKCAFLAASSLAADAATVAACPALLTLSLEKRLRPRVAFIDAARRARASAKSSRAPPASYLTWSDAMFADKVGRLELDEWTQWRDAWVAGEAARVEEVKEVVVAAVA